MRDFGDKVFEGAVQYYANYRPAYPRALFSDIVGAFGLDGKGDLLDLGCGTGELTIPLAKWFKNVLAMDPDAEMLEYGRKKAKTAGITNIRWKSGSSKTLTGVEVSFRLVTMGQSFHWMDQELVLNQLYDLIKAGGGLAIVGTEPAKQNSLSSAKDEIVKVLIKKYLGPKRRAGSKFYTPPPKKYEELLANSAFGNFKEHNYVIEVVRNVDQILGNLFSMSWALKPHFGDQIDNFETEFKTKLLAISPSGKFQDKIKFSLYIVRK